MYCRHAANICSSSHPILLDVMYNLIDQASTCVHDHMFLFAVCIVLFLIHGVRNLACSNI